MYNFLIFLNYFLILWCHLISWHWDLLPISHSSFGESKEKEGWSTSNGYWEQIYRALVSLAYFKTYPSGLWVFEHVECLWVSIEHPLNITWTPIESAWMCLSEYKKGWIIGLVQFENEHWHQFWVNCVTFQWKKFFHMKVKGI